MNSAKINIIEFPSNLGLKIVGPETEPGVRKLPDWLKKHHFHKRMRPENIFRLEPPNYSMYLDKESGVRNAEKIISYAKKQAELLSKVLRGNNFQIILGGDCSILIGNSIALRQSGEYGLFFLDGHTDFITPELSETFGAAGMDLAIVTGYGHEKLTNIYNLFPYFKERNVFCIGNREYDMDYIRPILESQIRYCDLNQLRTNGLDKTTNQFLNLVEKHDLDGFFIHLDVDVLNDRIMPAVDSRESDGLYYSELSELLRPLLSNNKAIGIAITILDPNLDEHGEFTTEFVHNFIEIIEYAKTNS